VRDNNSRRGQSLRRLPPRPVPERPARVLDADGRMIITLPRCVHCDSADGYVSKSRGGHPVWQCRACGCATEARYY